MGKFARDKGQRGEREIVDLFVELMERVETELGVAGHSAAVKRNTMQSDRGGFDLHGVPLLAVEVKRCETLALNAWWEQTVAQSKGAMPVLFYRQSRKPWRCVTFASLSHPPHAALLWARVDLFVEDFFVWYAELYRSLLLTC